MIWFACRSCGKKHGRPENSAGALVFCDCGQALTVPWESTAEAPEAPPAQAAPAVSNLPVPPPQSWSPGEPPPPPPVLVPVTVSEEHIPVVLPVRREQRPGQPPRRTPVVPRDRKFCFNHQDLPVDRACFSCGERFCTDCLVTFQDKPLCGPCKNMRIRQLDEPPRLSGLALTSALAGAALCLAGFCLFPIGSTFDILPLIIFALLLQFGTLGMAALAFYHTEKTSLLRGRSLALTGIIAAGVGIVLTIATTLYSYLQWV